MKQGMHALALGAALGIAATPPVMACAAGPVTTDGYEVASLAHAHWREGKTSAIPFVFVDVRTPAEYAEGHVPEAVNIPVNELPRRLGTIPHDKQIYVCVAGVRAARADKALAAHGFTTVEVVPASMRSWRLAGYPIRKGAQL